MADIDADNAGDAGMLGMLSEKPNVLKVLGGCKRGKYGNLLSRQAPNSDF